MRQIIFLLLFVATGATAQPLRLDMKLFAERRGAFMSKIESNSAAVFPCKPEYVRNGDVEYQYRQESNLYYLSGFQEPEAIMILNPSGKPHKYILFVRKKDPLKETWAGLRAGVEGAVTTFEADTALAFEDFKTSIRKFVPKEGVLYYQFGINPDVDGIMRELFLESRWGSAAAIKNPRPILSEMRLIKNDADMKMGLKKAVDISAEAHLEAIKSIHPGMYEYEIQSVFESVYRKNGSPRNGYPCIVGSGPNSCILHYDENMREMKDGEVLLMDCAAEYGYYSADITRTVPVNGKFTNEQKEIYRIVLDAQNAAMRLVKPGVIMKTLSDVIDSLLGTGLVRLGFIKDKKDHGVFTLHGYSHWIGLEVHDVGSYTVNGTSRPLEAGMCFTIEPGIYIRPDAIENLKKKGYSEQELEKIRARIALYRYIGVRIEDDVLVTEQGFINMSEAVPREIDQIELLMKQRLTKSN